MNNFKHILKALVTVIVAVAFLPGMAMSGDLDPGASPTPTMHTLEEIYNKIDGIASMDKALIEKTGQTTSYATGDDGDIEPGVVWPNPRFTDNGDGTVTDNLTNLVWLKTANCWGSPTWATALINCNNLASGSCGLTDGSIAGDWRLPSIKELFSLIDLANFDPALPSGHPFTASSYYYWSGTTYTDGNTEAWIVHTKFGYTSYRFKTFDSKVLPVRDAN
jgi:hypothetical protein